MWVWSIFAAVCAIGSDKIDKTLLIPPEGSYRNFGIGYLELVYNSPSMKALYARVCFSIESMSQ